MSGFFDATSYTFGIREIFESYSIAERRAVGPRKYCELIYKVSGSSDQIFPDRTLRLLPDCLYFIPKCCERNIFDVDVPGNVIVVILELYDLPDADSLIPEIIQFPPNNPILPQFERILAVWKKRKYAYALEAQSALMALLYQVASQRRQNYLSSSTYLRIKPAVDLIEQEYARDINIRELTALCGISGEYMRQLFRTYTGNNPMIHLRLCRLRHAKDMLCSGQYSVNDVAHACGYEDPNYFSRLFVQEYGIPPSHISHHIIG